MTTGLNISVLRILSWMKEQQSGGWTSLDVAAEHFGLSRDEMKRQMQSLQRYECVKRGGRDKEEWSITDQGLVRLAEARFSPSGAFLSAFDQSERSFPTPEPPAKDVTMIAVPLAKEAQPSDSEPAIIFPSPNKGDSRNSGESPLRDW